MKTVIDIVIIPAGTVDFRYDLEDAINFRIINQDATNRVFWMVDGKPAQAPVMEGSTEVWENVGKLTDTIIIDAQFVTRDPRLVVVRKQLN